MTGDGPGSDPPPRETVVQEAERRRMFRVAGGYLAGAFAVLQAVLTAVAAGWLPDGAFRVVLGVALLGFPVAMVLAWDFDITPRGVERTPEDPPTEPLAQPPIGPWLALVGGSVILGVILAVLR